MRTILVTLALTLAAGELPHAEEGFEWTSSMRRFFRSSAGREIVLDVTNADDHRWIAFQMMGLRYRAVSADEVLRYEGTCGAVFGAKAWLAGAQGHGGPSAPTAAEILCVPDPVRLALDVVWQDRVCRRAFHKRWNGPVGEMRFSCRGQLSSAEIEAVEREAPPAHYWM